MDGWVKAEVCLFSWLVLWTCHLDVCAVYLRVMSVCDDVYGILPGPAV